MALLPHRRRGEERGRQKRLDFWRGCKGKREVRGRKSTVPWCHPGWSTLAATLAAKAVKNICQCG